MVALKKKYAKFDLTSDGLVVADEVYEITNDYSGSSLPSKYDDNFISFSKFKSSIFNTDGELSDKYYYQAEIVDVNDNKTLVSLYDTANGATGDKNLDLEIADDCVVYNEDGTSTRVGTKSDIIKSNSGYTRTARFTVNGDGDINVIFVSKVAGTGEAVDDAAQQAG
jgi:hypothetical protein